LRIRIALSLGALVLAGGALTGGIAMASQSQPTAPPQATTRPTEPPSAAPPQATTRKPVSAPSAIPATTKPPRAEQAPRVPRAVPAGPTGDLHLPAIGVTR
jgi:hypothetical protein